MSKVVKIALLDSGIDISHNHLKPHIKENYTINPSTRKLIMKSKHSNTDFLGHGTACASAILRECSNIEIHSYKILDDKGVCSLDVLETVLNEIKNEKFDLINLSLAIEDRVNIKDLSQICKEIKDYGTIIVCSLGNGLKKSYPAVLKTCIGVQGFVLESIDSLWFNRRKKIQCVVDSTPFLHCDLKGGYTMFGKSNSYAAAKITGMLASILQNKEMTQKEIESLFYEKAVRRYWTYLDLKKSWRFPDNIRGDITSDPYIFKEVEQFMKRFLSLNKSISLKDEFLFSSEIGLLYEHCYPILKELERLFHITITNYTNVSREDFYRIDSLANLVERNMRKEALHEEGYLSKSY